MKKILIFLMLILISQIIFSKEIVRVLQQRPADSYFIAVLQMALDNTEKEYGKALIKVVDIPMTQSRSLAEVSKGKILDIDWAGTDIEREKVLLPIRVPLIGGLLGYRIPVINKRDIKKFDAIKTINDLKKLTAISGSQWPDSVILEASGFNLLKVPKFEQMYSMLENDRGDYFPRAISEVYSEISARNNNQLIIYDRIIIHYKFPMYFFTSKKNKKLAERVEKGLMIAVNNGTLLALIKSHSVTAPIFPLERFKNSLIFEIPNPILPKETPLNNKKLWIKLK